MKLKSFVPKNLTLVLIVFVAFALRVAAIDKMPPSLNWDEISHGYNAYSVLKTGKDEWGQRFPLLNFRAYGDYPLPLNLYLTIPFVAIWGVSEFSIRFPHALMGALTVLATYFLAYGVTRKRSIPLFASFLVATEPWSFFTSRFVVQSNPATLFLTLAAALFVNKDKHKYFLPFSFFAFFMTLFSYHATRIFTPIFLIFIIFYFKKEITLSLWKDKSVRAFSVAILALVFVTTLVVLLNKEAQARSKWLFLIDDTAISRIIEKRNESQLPKFVTRLLYNRPTYFIKEFTKNYLGYLSPQFLFINGGTQYQFSIPGSGILYLVNLPFFYLGLGISLMKSLKSRNYGFLLLWILLSPIPASITNEKFAVIRATTMLPIPMILSSIGLVSFVEWFMKLANKKIQLSARPSVWRLFVNREKALYFAYILVIAILSNNYLTKYFGEYKEKYSWSWQYGYKEIVEYAKENYTKFDKIIITKKYGEPHEFFLFYGGAGAPAPWPWDPKSYRNDPNLVRYGKSDWFWVDSFDKFYFVNDWDIPKEEWQDFSLESGGHFRCEAGRSCLLISSPGNYPKGWNKLQTISFLDGKPAFEIYSNSTK